MVPFGDSAILVTANTHSRDEEDEELSYDLSGVREKLSRTGVKIMEAFRGGYLALSATELLEAVNCVPSTLHKNLDELMSLRLVAKLGRGQYRLTDKGREWLDAA